MPCPPLPSPALPYPYSPVKCVQQLPMSPEVRASCTCETSISRELNFTATHRFPTESQFSKFLSPKVSGIDERFSKFCGAQITQPRHQQIRTTLWYIQVTLRYIQVTPTVRYPNALALLMETHCPTTQRPIMVHHGASCCIFVTSFSTPKTWKLLVFPPLLNVELLATAQ